jgi:NADP-dependent 3-hydroxy acid dehydrogenase YdfG
MTPKLVWLVTGCSSGFGEQFVLSILARGDSVIATGRNIDKIKHLQEHGAAIFQLDLTDPQAVHHDVLSEATKIFGRIDVLVNNASYISIGTWEGLE